MVADVDGALFPHPSAMSVGYEASKGAALTDVPTLCEG